MAPAASRRPAAGRGWPDHLTDRILIGLDPGAALAELPDLPEAAQLALTARQDAPAV